MTYTKQDVIRHFLESIGLDSSSVEAKIHIALKKGEPIPDDCLPGRFLMKFKERYPEEFEVLCTCTAKDWEHRI